MNKMIVKIITFLLLRTVLCSPIDFQVEPQNGQIENAAETVRNDNLEDPSNLGFAWRFVTRLDNDRAIDEPQTGAAWNQAQGLSEHQTPPVLMMENPMAGHNRQLTENQENQAQQFNDQARMLSESWPSHLEESRSQPMMVEPNPITSQVWHPNPQLDEHGRPIVFADQENLPRSKRFNGAGEYEYAQDMVGQQWEHNWQEQSPMVGAEQNPMIDEIRRHEEQQLAELTSMALLNEQNRQLMMFEDPNAQPRIKRLESNAADEKTPKEDQLEQEWKQNPKNVGEENKEKKTGDELQKVEEESPVGQEWKQKPNQSNGEDKPDKAVEELQQGNQQNQPRMEVADETQLQNIENQNKEAAVDENREQTMVGAPLAIDAMTAGLEPILRPQMFAENGATQMRSNDENDENQDEVEDEPAGARAFGKVVKGEYGYAAQPSYQPYDDSYSAPSYPNYGYPAYAPKPHLKPFFKLKPFKVFKAPKLIKLPKFDFDSYYDPAPSYDTSYAPSYGDYREANEDETPMQQQNDQTMHFSQMPLMPMQPMHERQMQNPQQPQIDQPMDIPMQQQFMQAQEGHARQMHTPQLSQSPMMPFMPMQQMQDFHARQMPMPQQPQIDLPGVPQMPMMQPMHERQMQFPQHQIEQPMNIPMQQHFMQNPTMQQAQESHARQMPMNMPMNIPMQAQIPMMSMMPMMPIQPMQSFHARQAVPEESQRSPEPMNLPMQILEAIHARQMQAPQFPQMNSQLLNMMQSQADETRPMGPLNLGENPLPMNENQPNQFNVAESTPNSSTSIPNHSSTDTEPSTSTLTQIHTSSTPNTSDVIVGTTLVDKVNADIDNLADKFLSPYFGKKDLVDFFDPSPYYYLPPQPASY